MSAIRTLAVEATDNGLLAPELAAGIRLREAPAVLLGRALPDLKWRSRWATSSGGMAGSASWICSGKHGRVRTVPRTAAGARGVSRAAYSSHTSSAGRSGVVIASSSVRAWA